MYSTEQALALLGVAVCLVSQPQLLDGQTLRSVELSVSGFLRDGELYQDMASGNLLLLTMERAVTETLTTNGYSVATVLSFPWAKYYSCTAASRSRGKQLTPKDEARCLKEATAAEGVPSDSSYLLVARLVYRAEQQYTSARGAKFTRPEVAYVALAAYNTHSRKVVSTDFTFDNMTNALSVPGLKIYSKMPREQVVKIAAVATTRELIKKLR